MNRPKNRPKQGDTSLTFCVNDIFLKFITDKWKNYDVYKREKHLASVLNRFSWFPTLLFSIDEKELLIYNYCGEPLTKNNCPKDAIKQINKILNDLDSVINSF